MVLVLIAKAVDNISIKGKHMKLILTICLIIGLIIPYSNDVSNIYAQDTTNIQNIHIEQQGDIRYLVWEQQNASKLKISQSSAIASIDIILFAQPGVNTLEIGRRTMVFDTYDNQLYGPFNAHQIYLPIARQ